MGDKAEIITLKEIIRRDGKLTATIREDYRDEIRELKARITELEVALDITTRQLEENAARIYVDRDAKLQHRPHIQHQINVNRELIRQAGILPNSKGDDLEVSDEL